jgi:hypothetical protein
MMRIRAELDLQHRWNMCTDIGFDCSCKGSSECLREVRGQVTKVFSGWKPAEIRYLVVEIHNLVVLRIDIRHVQYVCQCGILTFSWIPRTVVQITVTCLGGGGVIC